MNDSEKTLPNFQITHRYNFVHLGIVQIEKRIYSEYNSEFLVTPTT